LSNTAVLLAFLLRKARLVLLDMIFSISIFFEKLFRNQIAIEHLRMYCTAPMLSKLQKILMSRKKSLCQLATIKLFPQRNKKKGNSK